jgi:hypothetical protein
LFCFCRRFIIVVICISSRFSRIFFFFKFRNCNYFKRTLRRNQSWRNRRREILRLSICFFLFILLLLLQFLFLLLISRKKIKLFSSNTQLATSEFCRRIRQIPNLFIIFISILTTAPSFQGQTFSLRCALITS